MRTWLRVWTPFCRRRQWDPFEYEPRRLAALLAHVQHDTELVAAREDKPPQHARMKAARAAVSGLWGALYDMDAARSSKRVRAIQVRAARVAPMRTKNSTTWDVNLVFEYLLGKYHGGLRFTASAGPSAWALHRHRAVAIMLCKLHDAARSADVHSFSRGFFRGKEGPRLCLVGDEAAGIINKIRSWRPKTVGAGVGDYGKFKAVGPALATSRHPERAAFCFRTCLETYFRRTHALTRGDDGMWLSTTSGRRQLGADGKYTMLDDGMFYAVARDTVRSDVRWVMLEAGVPAQFLPHSTRAASSAAVRRLGGSEADVLSLANFSAKVYRDFYEKPIVTADGDEVTARAPAAVRAAFKFLAPTKVVTKKRRTAGARRLRGAAATPLALEDRPSGA